MINLKLFSLFILLMRAHSIIQQVYDAATDEQKREQKKEETRVENQETKEKKADDKSDSKETSDKMDLDKEIVMDKPNKALEELKAIEKDASLADAENSDPLLSFKSETERYNKTVGLTELLLE